MSGSHLVTRSQRRGECHMPFSPGRTVFPDAHGEARGMGLGVRVIILVDCSTYHAVDEMKNEKNRVQNRVRDRHSIC